MRSIMQGNIKLPKFILEDFNNSSYKYSPRSKYISKKNFVTTQVPCSSCGPNSCCCYNPFTHETYCKSNDLHQNCYYVCGGASF